MQLQVEVKRIIDTKDTDKGEISIAIGITQFQSK